MNQFLSMLINFTIDLAHISFSFDKHPRVIESPQTLGQTILLMSNEFASIMQLMSLRLGLSLARDRRGQRQRIYYLKLAKVIQLIIHKPSYSAYSIM